MKDLTKIEVERHGEHVPYYSLSCEYDGARFHVWLDAEKKLGPGPSFSSGETLFKNSIAGRGEPGYFSTRRLRSDSNAAKYIIGRMMDHAEKNQLFDLADQKYRRAEEARLAEAREAYRRRQEKDAGPELLIVLQHLIKTIRAQTFDDEKIPVIEAVIAAENLIAGIPERKPEL